ncbi:MAG TPA: hypothetical protein VFQ22_01250 [Longimicrobiales bacterium]|nr:hypothetical protein [Longimicrobiales bacterium]
MRFAYIDSHGNEIPIPSVDALALRIELGAIGPETELYDAQADRWGPAKTHEIFHTLSRDAEEEGFVAPPPPAAAPEPEPPPRAPEPALGPPAAELAPEPEPDDGAAAGPPDLGLTLAEPPPALRRASPAPAEAGESGFALGDADLGLELEPSPLDVAPDAASFQGMGPGAGDPGPGGGPAGGLGGGDDELLLERPMSEFDPSQPPGWMEPPRAEPESEGILDFSRAPAEVPRAAGGASREESGGDEVAAAPLPKPRAAERPKPRPAPRRRRQRSRTGPIVSVVLLAALGVGGYVSWPVVWPRVEGALAAWRAPERPPVVMPAVPAELLPRIRSLGEAAIADVIEEVDAATSQDAPAQPDAGWLAGTYLGDASQYPGVEAFWSGMARFVEGMRAAEWRRYHDRLAERVAAAGIPADTAALVTERADSGFVAAEAARGETYAMLDRLVQASLALHEFLLVNEQNIEYQPANTSVADPVLEAVPSSPEIGDRMWEMVDDITEALDALGTLDRVTRERLVSAFAARLQRVGIE